MTENLHSKKVLNIETVLSVILAVSILFCGTITFQVLTKGYASFFGFSFFRVVTGSMEPTIPTGALLICQDIDIEDIVIGDIVCFQSRDAYLKDSVITHRVHDIRKDSKSQIHLVTKGDANLSIDGYTTDENSFIGKVTWYTENNSFLLGMVKTVSTKTGFLTCIVFPILLISSLVLKECTASIMKELEQANQILDQPELDAAEQIMENTQLSDEEYQEMYERIKKELMEELGIGNNDRQN